MKIVNVIKNSMIDFPRRIACVAFTFGCNWNCWYCQNATLLDRSEDLTPALFGFLEKRKGLIDGVVICGGEPTIHPDLPDFIRKIKGMGFDVKLDTNGTNREMLASLIENKLVEYVAMDIKAPPEKLAEIVKSQNRLDSVEKSIDVLLSGGVEYEFRTTVTPDLTAEDIREMAKRIAGAEKYILQPYRKPDFLSSAPEPLKYETLKEYLRVAREYVSVAQLRE